MATTTNFGWTTPDDTALVKDGASAIRTLGSGIDTSLVDLKGGTTGQVLSKATNTDLDFTWVNKDTFKGCSLYSATIGVANATSTALPFSNEDFDTDSFHSNSTNNERITIPTGLGGKYLFSVILNIGNTNANIARISLRKNGTTTYLLNAGYITSTGYDWPLAGSMILDLVANDYIEVMFLHNKGSNLDIQTDSRFQAQYLGA